MGRGVSHVPKTYKNRIIVLEVYTVDINEYQELAMTTLNSELSKKEVLINSVMGLCGESREAIDIVKKWLAQGHELDKEHLAKDLGDIAWYLAESATALNVPAWIAYDAQNLAATIERLPNREEIDVPVEEQMIVELYSR